MEAYIDGNTDIRCPSSPIGSGVIRSIDGPETPEGELEGGGRTGEHRKSEEIDIRCPSSPIDSGVFRSIDGPEGVPEGGGLNWTAQEGCVDVTVLNGMKEIGVEPEDGKKVDGCPEAPEDRKLRCDRSVSGGDRSMTGGDRSMNGMWNDHGVVYLSQMSGTSAYSRVRKSSARSRSMSGGWVQRNNACRGSFTSTLQNRHRLTLLSQGAFSSSNAAGKRRGKRRRTAERPLQVARKPTIFQGIATDRYRIGAAWDHPGGSQAISIQLNIEGLSRIVVACECLQVGSLEVE
ncbi:hypothetical protein C8F01DRAFT_1093436 [Mycena amicta]|nr:hypothetical protein C8F01DRAFT_1093436 [Mycena amicta]